MAPTTSHLEAVVWAELLGLTARPVDRSLAMSLPAVAKGRNTLTSLGGRFPLIAYTGNTRQQRQPGIVTQPEPGRPRLTTMTWIIDALIFYGRAWLVVTDRYADTNRPRAMRWVPEWEATLDPSGALVGYTDNPKVAPADVVRIDGPHEGLLAYAPGLIREAVALQRATMNAAANPVPSVELHQTGGDPLSPEDVEKLRAQWGRARQGEHGGVGFTNSSIEVRTHGQAAEQLLLGARNAVALDLTRAMGLPAWVTDASVQGSSLTYSNTPSRSRELIDYGVMAYLAPIEARFSMDDILPAGQWCRFDTSDLLRADFKERMESYKVALDAGVYTLDQIHAMERGLPAEGDLP